MTCPSQFKTKYRGIVQCEIDEKHWTSHRGEGFLWRPSDELPRKVDMKPATTYDERVKPETANDKQVGGNHYKGDLQPIDVIDSWKLDFYEGSALKYLARHRKKNGREDIEKAIHYLELLLERQYK